MPVPTKFLVLLALTALLGGASSIAHSAPQPFVITSTLDGKTVLPHRIHWLAYPRVSRSTKVTVEHLIDGTVRWAERDIPYT